MSTQYSHPDYPQYSQRYSQYQQQSMHYDNSSYDASYNVNNNYYDDPQNLHPTNYVPVVNSSPVLPTSYNVPYHDHSSCAPVTSGETYLESAPMHDSSGGHMASYAPNSAVEMPQQDVPQYGNAHRGEIPPGQSWARPPAQPQYSEPAMSHSTGEERRGSLSQQPIKTEWSQDYNQADTGYYEQAHDNAAVANPVQHHAAPVSHTHSHSHSHDFNGYQQEQYSFPQQADVPQQTEPQPSFGLYSPRRHPQDQQLAQDASYESYDQQWNGEGGVPQCGLDLQREEYGVLPAQQPEPEQYQTPATSYNAHVPNTYAQNQVQRPRDYPEFASPSQSTSSQQPLSYPPQSSPVTQASSPQSTFTQTPSKVGPIRHDLFAQQQQAMGYQKHLEAKHNAKRQMAFQFGECESNQRRRLSDFTLDQTPTYAPIHTPRHQPQASSSSQRPIVPPIVPSQAPERSSPLAAHGTDNEDKKDTPPKKPALACLFCRKRKIACGPPPPDSPDRTCNQCQRRKQYCEYPTESRRGIRKTPKEAAPEEPTVHKFVHGDASLHDGTSGGRGRSRRKRASE